MQPSDQLTDTLAMYEVILSDFGKYMTAIQDGTLALPAPSLPASDAGGAEPANDTLALPALALPASDAGGAEPANGKADKPANDTGPAAHDAGDFVCVAERRERETNKN